MVQTPREKFTFDESILVQGLHDYIFKSMMDLFIKESKKRKEGLIESVMEGFVTGAVRRSGEREIACIKYSCTFLKKWQRLHAWKFRKFLVYTVIFYLEI